MSVCGCGKGRNKAQSTSSKGLEIDNKRARRKAQGNGQVPSPCQAAHLLQATAYEDSRQDWSGGLARCNRFQHPPQDESHQKRKIFIKVGSIGQAKDTQYAVRPPTITDGNTGAPTQTRKQQGRWSIRIFPILGSKQRRRKKKPFFFKSGPLLSVLH